MSRHYFPLGCLRRALQNIGSGSLYYFPEMVPDAEIFLGRALEVAQTVSLNELQDLLLGDGLLKVALASDEVNRPFKLELGDALEPAGNLL